VVNPTKAKIFETMAPTTSTLKVSPTRRVKKTNPRSNQHKKVHICTYLHSGMCIIKFHSKQHKVHTICTCSIDFLYEWINICYISCRCTYMKGNLDLHGDCDKK
jgi:hypothetical protein